ncbi:hypothetical protein ACLOJK_035305 [Asimina triloba]
MEAGGHFYRAGRRGGHVADSKALLGFWGFRRQRARGGREWDLVHVSTEHVSHRQGNASDTGGEACERAKMTVCRTCEIFYPFVRLA